MATYGSPFCFFRTEWIGYFGKQLKSFAAPPMRQEDARRDLAESVR